MIYVVIFAILIVFSYIAILLLYPINPFEMSLQLMFPVLFLGNLTFMLSTITRSGNGTAVLMIIIGIALMFLGKPNRFFLNVLLNLFPDNVHPIIWEILIKNRIFLLSASLVWMMVDYLSAEKGKVCITADAEYSQVSCCMRKI